MKKLLNALFPLIKSSPLFVYTTAAIFLWKWRTLLPTPASLGNFTRDALMLAVLLAGLISLCEWIRHPPIITKRVRETVARIGLANAKGEFPFLLSVRSDPNKAHGVILTIKNVGISILCFEKVVDRLEVGLGGKIYQMEYTKGTKATRIFLLPMKYFRPTIISPNDEAIGSIHIRHMINLLVIGATGTGKTVAIKTIIAKIAKYIPNFSIWLLDFKQLDFRGYAVFSHYYGYKDCVRGLEDYYSAFKAQQAIGVAGEPQYLVIDEWGSFITSLDKKEADRCKAILAELLMLGRGYGFFIICGVQRPDSSYFNSARDNFRACLALGDLSPEGRRMVFPDSVMGQITECHQREGHLYIDGKGLEKVRMADITDLEALDAAICTSINR